MKARRILRAVLCGLAALLVSPAVAPAGEGELLERGMALLQKGAHRKAAKVLEQANEEAGGDSLPILVGLSMAYNRSRDFRKAYDYAKRVLEATNETQPRVMAAGEIAYALAAGELEDENDELEEALDTIREYLRASPSGELSDRLRAQLCQTRRDSGIAVVSTDDPQTAIRPPRRIHGVAVCPTPADRRRLSRSEHAKVRAVIDTDGCVVNVEFTEVTSPVWGDLVTDQILEWVFEPATREGTPVAVYYELESTYSATMTPVRR